MAARGKKNGDRKKDKPRGGKRRYVWACIVSGCFFVLLSIFLRLPALSLRYLPLSKMVVNFVRYAFSGIFAVGAIFISFLLKNIGKKRIRTIAIACMIVFLPSTALSYGGQAVLEFYGEKKQAEELATPIMIMDLHDGLFSLYSFVSLQGNRQGIKDILLQEIRMKDAEIYKIDYSKYEALMEEAYDYEAAYLFFTENDLFKENNSQERLNYIGRAKQTRENAEAFYSTWDNRRCIALRYNDRGYEECRGERTDSAVTAYTEGIFWGFKALKLQYGTDGYTEDTVEIIDIIIRSYEGIVEARPEKSEEHKKAKLMKELMKEVRADLQQAA